MFENVDTQKKNDDFEKRITQIYNKYAGVDIAEEYMELEIGMSDLEIKQLFLQQMKVN